MLNLIKRSEVSCYKMSWGYVVGEMVELWDEVKSFNLKEMWSELLDVYSCFMVWLSDVSGLDLYIVNNKNIEGWKERWDWWKEWLSGFGLEFYGKYMDKGANYKRGSKREYVLRYALDDQCDVGLMALFEHNYDGGYLFNDKGEIASCVEVNGDDVVFEDMN